MFHIYLVWTDYPWINTSHGVIVRGVHFIICQNIKGVAGLNLSGLFASGMHQSLVGPESVQSLASYLLRLWIDDVCEPNTPMENDHPLVNQPTDSL